MQRRQKFGPGGSRAAVLTYLQQIGLGLLFRDLSFGFSFRISFQ